VTTPGTNPDGKISRALLIVNPGARRASAGQSRAMDAFARARIACEVIRTEAPGHATGIARERARDFDAVFTLGGDGTAMEVMTALAGAGPPVGILPGGTGNVLARSFGIPLRIDRAVPALLGGREALIDLGRLDDGRRFAIGVGVGLDEKMIAGASKAMKRRAGIVAYVWSATAALLRMQKFAVRLTVDGKVYERDAASVMIANLGDVLGGLLRFGDGILHDDGLLQACIYSPEGLWDAFRIFYRMSRGTAHQDPCVLCVSGKEFRLETTPARRAQADGELLDETPLGVRVEPNAARLLLPIRAGAR
jgi:diacylglycerol kinase (ATP)